MGSIWQDAEMPTFGRQKGNITTDVLVIGGGAAGLLCTYFLHRAGVPCVLVEQNRICGGVTRNTTAKITAQHGFIFQKIAKTYGIAAAKQYYRANTEAIEEYGRQAQAQNIDCDFTYCDNYIYTLDDRQAAEREVAILSRIGCRAALADRLPLPFETAGAVRMPRQARFHPLKFFGAIAEGLPILENTRVREMVGNTAVTDTGTIRAEKVIVATHFPFINKHGSYFLKMYQHRSYVLALAGAPDLDGMYADEADGGLSFRNAGDYLLFGGRGARTGKACGGYEALKKLAARYYPDATVAYAFATQDCMTLDGIPYIGQYSARTKGLYVATGFNKWGMTGSMVAARLLCDAILGKRNEYARVFNPSRSILHPQLALNGAETIGNLLSFSGKRCPHLGCALHWNAAEHSWDCPCHGSRFAADGRVLDNPANGDLKK